MKKILNLILISSITLLFIFGFDLNISSTNGLSNKFAVKAATNQPEWLDTVAEPSDYDYSFAVIGDTQNITFKFPEKLDIIYDYIVDNVESKKIAYVLGLGDITDGNSEREWEVARRAIYKLDGVVPYSLVRGNHDGKENYLKHFGNSSPYRKQYKASFMSSLNTACEFSVGDLDYLVLNLDYLPSDEILAWASSVVEAHPYHNVIVTTHANLEANGSRYDSDGGNGGTAQWEKFTSKHPNIVLGLYGHVNDEYLSVVKNEGVNGNIVTELLIDPQATDLIYDGGVGIVAFLYFSNGGKNVELRYYSTIRNQYYRPENQFSFEINTIARKA